MDQRVHGLPGWAEDLKSEQLPSDSEAGSQPADLSSEWPLGSAEEQLRNSIGDAATFKQRVLSADATICLACVNLSAAIVQPLASARTGGNTFDTFLVHHGDMHSLEKCAPGCKLCSLILYCFHREPEMARRLMARVKHPKLVLKEIWGHGKRLLGFQPFFCDGFFETVASRSCIRAYAYPDDVASARVIGRPVQPNSGSLSTLDLAKSWITDCATNHHECKWGSSDDEADPLLPTRVIDVGESNEGTVRLIATQFLRGKWLALSHRWGDVKFLTTKTTNLEQMKNSIKLSLLPATFCDAIVITRHFGLRYLWIDSLCILQDSPEDWQVESSNMPDVYKNAYATIAAAATKDCRGGIFVDRVWSPESKKSSIPVPYQSGLGKVYFDLDFNEDLAYKDEVRHLDKRAWCFQESQLSRRHLKFDQFQVSFKCVRHGLVERRESPPAVAAEEKNHFLWRIQESHLKTNDLVSWRSLINIWYNLLADYTSRSLTFPGDKFVAISGIANVIGVAIKDDYHAGLWGRDMPEALLWSPYEEETLPNAPHVALYPPQYRAPSWSWASVEGPISCFICREAHDKTKLATVFDVKIATKGQGPYGQVKAGYLKIKGPFEHATVTYCLTVWPYQPALRWDKEPEDVLSYGIYDVGTFDGKDTDVWCIHVTSTYGLMLKPVRGFKDTYSRIGIFHRRQRIGIPNSWQASGNIKTIAIV